MPINSNIPIQVQGVDPNGFTNALAAGMKMRELRNASERLARKDELTIAKTNALQDYGMGDRSEESLRRVWASSPEAALAIEKNQRNVGLTTAKISKANAEGAKATLGVMREAAAAVYANPTRENFNVTLDWLDSQHVDTALWRKQVDSAPDQALPGLARGYAMSVKDSGALENQTRNVDSQIGDRDARRAETESYHDATLAGQEAGRAETRRKNLANEARPLNGMSLSYDAEGRPVVQVGETPMGKPAINMLEETQIKSTEALARLDEIERVAKPELLTYGNKVKDAALDVKSKFGGEMSPDQAKFRNEVTDMRQSTMDHLNRTIKDQTGATITVQEVPRIAATVPTMDDAPDQFPRKLKNATRLTRNAIIRAQIAREQGMDPLNTGIDLGDTKTLMNKREQQLRRHHSARAPGMAPGEVDAAIEKQLRQEFGY